MGQKLRYGRPCTHDLPGTNNWPAQPQIASIFQNSTDYLKLAKEKEKKKKKDKSTQAVKAIPHINRKRSHFGTEYCKAPPPRHNPESLE
jgi:hypothetical protein